MSTLVAGGFMATCLTPGLVYAVSRGPETANGNPRLESGFVRHVSDYADKPTIEQFNVGEGYAFAPIGKIRTDQKILNVEGDGTRRTGISNATAVMVSPCHVLTNRHVIFGDSPAVLNGWSSTFSVGNDGTGKPAYVVKAAPAVLPAGDGEGTDWVLMVLNPCIPDMTIGWMNMSDLVVGRPVLMAGFRSDRTGSLPTASLGCSILEQGAKFVFSHSCFQHVR